MLLEIIDYKLIAFFLCHKTNLQKIAAETPKILIALYHGGIIPGIADQTGEPVETGTGFNDEPEIYGS